MALCVWEWMTHMDSNQLLFHAAYPSEASYCQCSWTPTRSCVCRERPKRV